MLEVRDLSCVRGDHRLFANLAFTMQAGELLHLRGHNGSGKTSLIRTLCGLMLPAEGEVLWNGKSIRSDGSDVGVHTMPIVWGGTGTNGQHAFHQLLHQGTRSFAADFILIAEHSGPGDHHRWLLANALAQSQAMLLGAEEEDPHRRVPGNKGSTTIVLDALTPAALGALLALYEHMVFCQGVIWDINSFDQWGVELGKRLALPIFEQLGGKSAIRQDSSTRALVEHLSRRQRRFSDEDAT